MANLRVALIGNGTFANYSSLLSGYEIIIALDGGVTHCLVMGITPHHVVGDGDSLPTKYPEHFPTPETAEQFSTDQNSTDLMKALRFIESHFNSATNTIAVDLFCVSGLDRMDHTIAAVQMLQYEPLVQRIYTTHQQLQVVHTSLVIESPVGTSVSLLPVAAEATVELVGFEWSGQHRLNALSRSGISNTVTHSPATIQVVSGACLVITNL